MADTFTAPEAVKRYIREAGYDVDESMDAYVNEWWGWYGSANGWYNRHEIINKRQFKLTIASLHPARRVCREWASAILDDDATKFSVSDQTPVEETKPAQTVDQVEEGEAMKDLARAEEDPTEALMDWVTDTGFIPTAQRCLERAFALGTGALALWFQVMADGGVRILARRYDARMIIPLSWDSGQITECAFCTTTHASGRELYQLSLHVVDPETDTYHVHTRLFTANGDMVRDDAVIDDFDTMSERPTFCILRPAIDNIYSDSSAFGQSIFADAIDAIKGVDNAFDSIQREIAATKVKVFMSDDLFDVEPDGKGGTRPVPMDTDALIIRKVAGNGMNQVLEIFAPEIRMSPLVEALNTALAEVGDLCGFGANYFRFDKSGNIKTAKEVTSDNAVFARSLKKHENYLKPELESLLGTMLDCKRRFAGQAIEEPSRVIVEFDDGIISDTETEKAIFMQEVASMVAPPWEYRTTFRGEDEATAKRMIQEARAEDYDPDAMSLSVDDVLS